MDRVDLLYEADELADLILQMPEVQTFRAAKAKLDANPEAVNLMRRFRELGEQVAEFQARKVPPMHYSYLLEETDQLMARVKAIPEVQAFEEAEERMNALLDSVTSRLSSAVEEKRLDRLTSD